MFICCLISPRFMLSKRIDINICHFLQCLFKMTDCKLYPNLPPSAPPENPQVVHHLSIIQAKMQGLKNQEQMFKQKYEKYNKILNRLTWLNACSSRISIATGISSVATFATFLGLPVEIVKCGFWCKLPLLPLLWHANTIDKN